MTRKFLILAGIGALGVAAAALYWSMQSPRGTGGDAELQAVRAGPYVLRIGIDPPAPVVGRNRLILELADAQGEPLHGARIQAYAEMPAMGTMAAMRAPAELSELAPGRYAGPFELEMRGAWPLTLRLEHPDMAPAELSFDMATGRQGLELGSGGTALAEREADEPAPPAAGPGGFYTAGPYELKVTIEPQVPAVGDNRLTVAVRAPGEDLPDDLQLRAVANMPAMPDMPAVEVEDLAPTGAGRYAGTLALSMGGDWALAVDAHSEALGHGDLVLSLSTGSPGLQAEAATPGGISHYTCAMHPSVHSASEGACPICSMDLVPVTDEEVRSGTITVTAQRRQLIGVTTAPVRRARVTRELRAVGTVTHDETRLADVSLKFDAWIGELNADATGIQVTQGDTLFTVYGPELLAAQDEYLEARRRGRSPQMIQAARRRLGLWDVTPGTIAELERRGRPLEFVPIAAPISGTVFDKPVVAGASIKAGTRLLRIADLSRLWVEAEVYESELEWVRPGLPVTIHLPYLPGREFSGRIDFVYPYLEGATRTGRIRVLLDNPDGVLKPAMYAEVRLSADLGERLVVPEQAVLYAGDSRVVFVDRGEGRLEPRRITTGVRNRELIEVLDGLQAGETVVTSGNFLIAAETRLKAGIQQW